MNRFLSIIFLVEMLKNKCVLNQVDESLLLISRLKDLGVKVSEQLQVAAIISKLLDTWNDYGKKIMYICEDFTINQLINHILIEEGTHIRENKFALESGLKVNNINYGAKKFKKAVNKARNKRKHATISSDNSTNNKKNKTCFFVERKVILKKNASSIRN